MKNLVAERIQGEVGALLATGFHPMDVGNPLNDYETLDIQAPAITDGRLLGTVVYIDHFGNCITNMSGKESDEFGLKPGDSVIIQSPQAKISAMFGTSYSDVSKSEEIVFVSNNHGMVQLSINLGNFASTYGVKAGAKIEIEK